MNTRRALVHALACAALLSGTAAHGQGIWRCGAQGNSFSDRPCADGRVLPAAPAPSALAVRQAAEVAQREAMLAIQLRSQRLAREQQFQRSQAALQHAARQPHQQKNLASSNKPPKDQRRQRPELPLRVAAGPASLSPPVARRAQERTATADARTSAAAVRGFPATRD